MDDAGFLFLLFPDRSWSHDPTPLALDILLICLPPCCGNSFGLHPFSPYFFLETWLFFFLLSPEIEFLAGVGVPPSRPFSAVSGNPFRLFYTFADAPTGLNLPFSCLEHTLSDFS